MEPLLGALHPWTAAARLNLGSILIELRDYDAASQEFERVKAIAAANYPGDHPLIAAAHLNAAVAHSQRGRLAEALAEDQAAVAMYERLHGPRHQDVAQALCNMSARLRQLGRLEEGLAAVQRAASIQAEVLDADHCDVLLCNTVLGSILDDAGRHAEALRVFEPTHERFAARDCSPEAVSELELQMARALWSAQGQHAKPRALALLDAASHALVEPQAREELERLRAAIR
jgi:tetratricopeptide (TPR) repeat protein